MIDRMSNLPDEVAHNILAFLDITDLTRFGCVSKRCRELYLSTPSLDFDGFSDANTSTCSRRLMLLSSLDRFLLLHCAVNKIQRFRICWNDLLSEENPCFIEDVRFRVITWIHNAVRCKVEVLEVDVSVFEVRSYFLPSSVFLCGSLRSLLLSSLDLILKAPSLASSSNLECLKLEFVDIEDDKGFFKWISCSCKCIKELHLYHVFGIEQVIIESPSLKSFSFVHHTDSDLFPYLLLSISGEKLEDVLIDWEFGSTFENFLNIFAPNLKYLKWSGNVVLRKNLGEFMCLEKAQVFLKPQADDVKILSEVLRSITINRVEALVLNKETTMALLLNGVFVPGLLKNVCHLSIHIGSFLDILVPEMVSTFGGTCNLRTLEIKSDPQFLDLKTDCSGFNMGYWRLQNLAFIPHLKEVTIELSNGSNGIELAAYMLEYAQNLKKMVIVHSPQQYSVIRKLNKSKRISSATVVFQEDQQRGNKKQRLR